MIKSLAMLIMIIIGLNNQYTILINKDHKLEKDYIPSDLIEIDVDFYNSNIERKYMRKDVAIQLKKMFDDAKKENVHLVAISGYRSYESQIDVYRYNINTYGEQYANTVSAKPGESEHQTGLAMDVSSKSINYQLINEFSDTPEGIWLKNNCHKYGFIIRYPENKEEITGYIYESWHIRYVGIYAANYIYNKNITLEEYKKQIVK